MSLVKSVSDNQEEIIRNILRLYVPTGKIDCDATYSTGQFYKHIEAPKYKFDIYPQTEDTTQADCRHLPLEDASIGCLMFDPPFLATTGPSLKKQSKETNLIVNRFGAYSNEKELHRFYADSLKEFHRILRDSGILIFKCQDKVSSSKQYLSHCFIINKAIAAGFYPKDLFILVAKSRLVADWQAKNQKHARKFHSYFIVFQKCSTVIQYE